MKSFWKVFLVIFMLSMTLCLFGEDENHPYDRGMMWYKSKDVNNHSKYAVPEYAGIKQDIVNYLLLDITDDRDMSLETEYTDKITDELWLNSNFYGYPDEQGYYMSGDETDDEGNLNCGSYDPNEDISCVKQIDIDKSFRFLAYVYEIKPRWEWIGDFAYYIGTYAEIYFEANLNIIFNNANRNEIFNDDYSEKFVGTGYYWYNIEIGRFYIPSSNSEEWEHLNVIYNCESNDPLIKNKTFQNNPGEYFYIEDDEDKCWNTKTLWGTWGNEQFEWGDERKKILYFYAKSPLPYIMGEKIFTKHFDAAEDTIPHNNKIYDTEIKTDYHVKVLYARFYKYNEDDNVWEYDKDNNPDIVRIMSKYEDGIDKLKITDGDKKRLQDDGKYMMIVSCIDKFNKIFVFEPEYFVIDKEAPTVTGESVNNDDFFTTTAGNPVIASFEGAEIEDNILDFNEIRANNQLDQYIYIKEKYVTDPVLLADSVDFKFEDNKIILETQDKYVYVEKIYIQDKAGNESRAIVEDQTYAWDKTAPRVLVSSLNGAYLTSRQNLYLDIIEEFGVDISKIQVELRGESSGTVSTGYHYYPSMNNDLLIVDLNNFNGKEEKLELILTLTDFAGNERLYKDNELLFDYDDKAPDVTAVLNGDSLYNYYIKAINTDGKINIVAGDLNFDKTVLDFSAYGTRENIILESKDAEYTLSKLEGIENEKFTIRVKDKAGNETLIENICLSFSDDDDAPIFVNALQDVENEWRYYLEAYDKGSYIKYVYFKEIETDADEVIIDDFGSLPTIDSAAEYNGWSRIAENIKLYKSEIDILPGRAVCFVLIDGWGNVSEGLILQNKAAGFYEVYDRQDLIDANWDLSGDVIVYGDLTINTGETLLIRSTNDKGSAAVRFSPENGKKIKIINNGTIDIDTLYGDVVFTSLNESNEDYSWFGIINESGILDIDGENYRTIFKNAVSPIVYENPLSTVSLGMIDFVNCKMGIHFIDDAADYSNLEISNINFTNLIYGIKFDLLDINNKGSYLGARSYLTEVTSITKDNIIRSDIYCPVYGLLEFENVNNAPEAVNVNIKTNTGEFGYGEELEIVFDFRDIDTGDTLDESNISYQWYYSNNMQGPYSPITDQTEKTWTVDDGYGGKWIKARVIVRDNNGGISSPGYSLPRQMGNAVPAASDVVVKVDPDRLSGNINIYDILIADFEFTDDDGDLPGDHIYNWYISDTENYLEIEDNPYRTVKSWIIDEELEDKHVYFTVNPVDDANGIGELQRSNIVHIQNLGIPRITGNITLVPQTIDGYETLVGEFEVDTTNTTGSIDNFIYDWFKTDRNNVKTAIEGFKNTLQILDDFEGCKIELVITPRNEDGEAGLPVTSEPYLVEYIPPAVSSFKIECMNSHDLTWDVINEDPALPMPGNKFVVTAVPEVKEGFEVYIEYKWYINDGNSLVRIDGETGNELVIREEWLKRTIAVEAIPFIITYDENNVMEKVPGDGKSESVKTCDLVDLQIMPDDNITDFIIIDSGTNTITYLYDLNADTGSYDDILFKNYIDLSKNEVIKNSVTAVIEVQGAGGGGGGGCDSIVVEPNIGNVAGGGGGGGSAGVNRIEENILLSFYDACTVQVGKGGEGGPRRTEDYIDSGYPGGNNGGNTAFLYMNTLGESNDIAGEGGIGGTSGSLWYTIYNAPYVGVVISQRALIHGEGGESPSDILEHDGQDAYDPDLENLSNGGTGGNGGSINGDVINGGYCQINSDGRAHEGYPGEDAEIDSGNGGGGGGGGGEHPRTTEGDGTHTGGSGGNGGNGYMIIELSGEMYTTDWE